VKGRFQASADAPESRPLWPADYVLWLTCHLLADRLQLTAIVENVDQSTLPFGLGYHPYFLLTDTPGDDPSAGRVEAPARSYWELSESLPTGARFPVSGGRDLNQPRRVSELTLDDVLTGLPDESPPGAEGLCSRGRVNRMFLYASPAFQELVVFTPPHRKAMCLEPYTCTTDAINLEQRGVDAGLLVLPPGQQWAAVVEMVVA
jgi:aldose 1-epimerase